MTGRGYDDDAPSHGATMLDDDEPNAWETNSALSTVRGVPWWAAVLLALAFTAIGVFVDMERINRLGVIFQATYFLGCVIAVLWVQRRGLFGPMVQPPLILAVTVPVVVLVASDAGADQGLTAKALAIGTPLINGFPTMAVTTGVTVLIAVVRLARERAPRSYREPADRSARRRSRQPIGRTPGGRQPDVRQSDPRRSDARRSDAARSDTGRSDTGRSDGRRSGGRQPEPRRSDVRSDVRGEPRQPAARQRRSQQDRYPPDAHSPDPYAPDAAPQVPPGRPPKGQPRQNLRQPSQPTPRPNQPGRSGQGRDGRSYR